MALINCPECNNQVSTTAEVCPHCGFNIKKIISYCPLCKSDKVLMDYLKDKNELVCPKCGFGGKLSTPEDEARWAEQRRIEEEQKANVPPCPFCNSTNIHKISGTERAVSVIGLGLFSKKINKSFKCNNCGGTF